MYPFQFSFARYNVAQVFLRGSNTSIDIANHECKAFYETYGTIGIGKREELKLIFYRR